MCTGIFFKNEDFPAFFFQVGWEERSFLLPLTFTPGLEFGWKELKKNGDRDEGDPGQVCLSQIPGNPSLLPAFLGWNWADLEQEMPLGGSLRN